MSIFPKSFYERAKKKIQPEYITNALREFVLNDKNAIKVTEDGFHFLFTFTNAMKESDVFRSTMEAIIHFSFNEFILNLVMCKRKITLYDDKPPSKKLVGAKTVSRKRKHYENEVSEDKSNTENSFWKLTHSYIK